MPSKEQIQEGVANLRTSSMTLPELADGDQIWKGKQYGARYELTRPTGGSPHGADIDTFTLVLTGKVKGKQRLLEEFKGILGEPKIEFPALRFSHPIMLMWDTSKVLDRLSSDQASS